MELPNNAVIILSPAHILQVITTIFHFSFDIKFIVTNIDCLCKYLSLTNVMYILRMTSRPKHLHLAKITFFFPREAFCGLEYAENLFAAGALPGPHWGAHNAPPPHLAPTAPRPSRIRLSGLPNTHNLWLRHCFVYSRRLLIVLIVSASTTESGKLFQMLTTREQKENFLKL